MFHAYHNHATNDCVRQGFQMVFANGVRASVAFGSFNYCDKGVTTAEVWAWNDATGNPVTVPGFSSGDVVGHLSADTVVQYLAAVAAL